MASTKYPYFSQPGWLPFVLTAGAAAAIWHYYGFYWSLPVWLICIFLVFLFRDPERQVPSIPLAVVSPADGLVSHIDKVTDPYLDRQARRIVIDMHQYGVYSTRSPVEGKIMDIKDCNLNDGQQHPHGVWIQTDEKDDIVVVMGRGALNSTPKCYIRIGEKVGQGQRCGYVRLGGKVEVYLPESSRIGISEGAHVAAGSDVIATLVHK